MASVATRRERLGGVPCQDDPVPQSGDDLAHGVATVVVVFDDQDCVRRIAGRTVDHGASG
jgi:hypothetical protein